MERKTSLLSGSLLLFIIFFSGCTQQNPPGLSNHNPGLELMNMRQAVPSGWNYTIFTQSLENTPRPHGLWVPLAMVNFTNPSLSFQVPGGEYRPLSLQLYFYTITQKQEIMGIIDNESFYSWCIPIYFSETNTYLIVTSPCYINSGVFTEETEQYYTVLEESLKEYFDGYT